MVLSFSSSVEAIPITDDTLFCEGEELWICKEKSPVNTRLQIHESSFDQLLYFNDVLTQKLNDVRWHPWMAATDDLLQMALPNMAVVMPGQNAVKQVPLHTGQFARTNQGGVVVDAGGDLNGLPVYAYLEGAPPMRIFRKDRDHRLYVLTDARR